MRYFLSDFHFGHAPITGPDGWERRNFKDIQEHDEYIIYNVLKPLAEKTKDTDEVWILGDWGDISRLWVMEMFPCQTFFVYGNHDKKDDIDEFRYYFDEVYLYPVFISNKLVISHIPVAVFEDTVNVHGHLHGAILDSPNYICASVHVVGYKPVTDNHINGAFSKLPKYTRHWLEEPYMNMYKIIQPRDDVIVDRNGRLDVSASRLLRKMRNDK